MTRAQHRALRWLNDRGGSGVLDRYGRVVAGGEAAGHISPTTWLRLTAQGDVYGVRGRLTIRASTAIALTEEISK